MVIYLNAKKTTWKEKLERANIWVEVLLNCRPTKQHAALDKHGKVTNNISSTSYRTCFLIRCFWWERQDYKYV